MERYESSLARCLPRIKELIVSPTMGKHYSFQVPERSYSEDAKFGLVLPVLVGSIIAVAMYRLMVAVTYTTYTTTDDVYLAQVISGAFTGKPSYWAPFLSPVLVSFIAFLYEILPGLSWYRYMQRITMLLSLGCINSCICMRIRSERRSPNNYLLQAFICTLIDTSLCWAFVRMHFYYVSMFAGCAAIALAVSDTDALSGRYFSLKMVLICFFMFLCCSYNLEISYVAFLFLIIAFAKSIILIEYNTRLYETDKVIKIVITIAIIIVMIGCTLASIKLTRNIVNGEAYTEWNSYRLTYWDYDKTSWDAGRERFESAGWTENFYNLTKIMYFIDYRFTTPYLSQIVSSFSRMKMLDASNSLLDAFRSSINLFVTSRQASSLLCFALGVTLASLLAVSLCDECRATFLSSLACFIVALGECLYLSLRGRFPFRAFAVVICPCIVFLSINLIELLNQGYNPINSGRHFVRKTLTVRSASLILAPVICALILSTHLSLSYLLNADSNNYYHREWRKETIIYNYCMEHKDSIYILDFSTASTCYPHDVGRGELSNLFCWGGARLHTKAFRTQLENAGLPALSSETFAYDNVFLISNSEDHAQLLMSFLKESYGFDHYDKIDDIGSGISVYSYTRLR